MWYLKELFCETTTAFSRGIKQLLTLLLLCQLLLQVNYNITSAFIEYNLEFICDIQFILYIPIP